MADMSKEELDELDLTVDRIRELNAENKALRERIAYLESVLTRLNFVLTHHLELIRDTLEIKQEDKDNGT